MLLNLQPRTKQQYETMDRLNLMTYDTSKALKFLADNGVNVAGKSFEEVDKAMRGFVASQTKTKEGTGKFNNAYRELVTELSVSQSAFYDANGKLKSMDEISKILKNSLNGLTDAQKQHALMAMFGTDAIRAATILSKEGAEGINEMGEAMRKVTAEDTAKEKMNNLKGSLEQLKGSVETLAISLGTHLIPMAKAVVDKVTSITNSFLGMSDGSQKAVLAIGGILAVIPLLIGGLGGLISNILKIREAIILVKGSTAALNVMSWLNPIGLVIAAIAAIGAGVYLCYKNFDKLKEGFMNMSTTGKILTGILIAMNPALAIIAGITLAIKGVQYAMSDSIPPVQLFGKETSKATQEAVGAYMKLDNEAGMALMRLKCTGEVVSSSMKTELVKNFNDMGTQIKDGLKKKFDESYKVMDDFFKKSSALSEAEEQEILTKKKATYDKQVKEVDAGTKRINEILEKAKSENRKVSEDEFKEIEGIKKQMAESAVKNLSATELESKAILERMHQQASNLSAQQAAEVVKNSLEQKNKAVKNAEDQYNDTIKNIIKMRDETGEITADQAKRLIDEATKQKDETIKKANEMHNGVVEEAKKQAGEHVGQIDWTTGEILSRWQIFKNDCAKKWEDIKADAVGCFEWIKKGIGDKVDEITEYVPKKWDEFKTATANKFGEIKQAIADKIAEIKQDLKDMFTVDIKLPKIPTPYFEHIGGSNSFNPIDWIKDGVPDFDIKWHEKGGIATGASIVGIGEEVGVEEAIVPLSGSHMKPFANAIADMMSRGGKGNGMSQEFNFYSPKALDESEIQRNIREVGREQAMEWGLL